MAHKLLIKDFKHYITNKFPTIILYYRFGKWHVFSFFKRSLIRFESKASGLHINPYTIYWIPPTKLEYSIYKQIDGIKNTELVTGIVKDGDWDKKVMLTQELDIVKAANAKFIGMSHWQDTKYYRVALDNISKGIQWRGCTSKEDLDKYFIRFEELYEKIISEGYKTQDKISDPIFGGTGVAENEIAIHIDRYGRFLFANGAHRLSIALVLGIESIPVKCCIRHSTWQKFVNEILSYAKKQRDGKLYQPLTHPDLKHISSTHGQKRFELIRENLKKREGYLLDIGSQFGYFCHRFEDLGFSCIAVEHDPETAYFLKKLKLAENRKFTVIEKSILTYRDNNNFAVVLALNIFHHFLKTKSDYDALIRFLEEIETETIFFEPHQTSERQMSGAYRNYEPEEFVKFILKHARMQHSKLIGTAEDGRQIYMLSK